MKNVIYADNNATTMVDPEVFEAMRPFFCEQYGNPSSMHSFGGRVAKEMEEARSQVAAYLHADHQEIIFTSCATESNNTAIRGVLEAYPQKRHIVTTCVEHPAVLNVARAMQKAGYDLTELSVKSNGLLDLNELTESLRDDTVLVSIMYANNETGVVFPMEEIAGIVKERDILLHCDGVQAFGKIPVNLKTAQIDLFSMSGHKLHAPKGVGALYVRRGVKCAPFMIGGHQEHNRRGGTENVPSVIALGKACEIAQKYVNQENNDIRALRDNLEKGILESTQDSRVNGSVEHRLPNTSNISFGFIEGEAILLMLNQYGIAASSGSACTSGSLQPSHVLRAMGVSNDYIQGSIRFSLSRFTTEKEIEVILEKLPPIIDRLREISPFVK